MTVPENGHSRIPPGFRFHPTDEELVDYYLRKKVALEKFDLDVIREIDLNKFEPWDLHEKCRIDSTQTEWYFFSHKDKKYPTGTRTNRATAVGFWKATGRDKAVYSFQKRIGMRKTLVFYRGRAPHGQKTDWIMHEYRMEDSETGLKGNEDGWVICRVFEKRSHNQKGHGNLSAGTEDEQVSCAQKSINSHGHSTPSQSFTCKQEVETEFSQEPCIQLPHLESPKRSCSYPCSNLLTEMKRNPIEKKDIPLPISLDLTGLAYSKSFITEDTHQVFLDNGQLTDWGMIENGIPREIRHNPEISFSAHIQYPSFKHLLEDHSIYEVDLWNFTR